MRWNIMLKKSTTGIVEKYQTTLDYDLYFKITGQIGMQPFVLNKKTLTVTSIRKGFIHKHFLFNVFKLWFQLLVAVLLIFRNWWTKFNYDTMNGNRYLMQTCWAFGYGLGLAFMMTTLKRQDELALFLTNWIRFEKKLDGTSRLKNWWGFYLFVFLERLPESASSKSWRVVYLKLQFILYSANVLISLPTLAGCLQPQISTLH